MWKNSGKLRQNFNLSSDDVNRTDYPVNLELKKQVTESKGSLALPPPNQGANSHEIVC